MREEVRKYLFIGLSDEKEPFFQHAQQAGCIQFIDPLGRKKEEVPEEVQQLLLAIKVLRRLPVLEQEEGLHHVATNHIVTTILTLHAQYESLQEQERVLATEIARISPFGHFSCEDIAAIEQLGHCHVQFFCARSPTSITGEEPNDLIFISSVEGLDYYIAINDREVVHERMVELKFEHSLDELQLREQERASAAHRIEQELKSYAKYQALLHTALIDQFNHYHLSHAQSAVQGIMDDTLFAIEGWVPAHQVGRLKEIISPLEVTYEEVAITPTDVIPTCLDNRGMSRLGEDLVHIYDTPSATDKDPSPWVLWGFALFFSFIIADAGYGLIFLVLALFIRYRYPLLKGTAKRALNLFTVLSIACIGWGTLMTSFFGIPIAPDNPLRRISLVHWLVEKKADYELRHGDPLVQELRQNYPELREVADAHTFVSFIDEKSHKAIVLDALSDQIMFELALFIGVLHLLISLCRYVGRQWQHIGWIAFLIGAYLYFPAYLNTPSLLNFVGGIDLVQGGEVGLQLMSGGIATACLLSIIRHGWTGIFEIAVLIQVFADTLSYLRLYALGLSGAIVSATINEIASTLPLLPATLLILISHATNMILGTMSGVIHGLRLNFLEWYHYSFEGGGKQFQPLKLLIKE